MMRSVIINKLWYWNYLSRHAYFQKNIRSARQIQENILLGLISRNCNTEFGKTQRFRDIDSYKSFQSQVPIQTYDDYRPLINRIQAGEDNILTKERVGLLEPTGGSSGGTKYIPYTLSVKNEFLSAIGPWVVNMIQHHPGMIKGRSYWTITPSLSQSKRQEGSIPIGFEDDFEYFGAIGKLLRFNSIIKSNIREIKDVDQFMYVTACSLLKANDLAFVSIWNPALWTLLIEYIQTFPQKMITGLKKGIPGFMRPSARRAEEVQNYLKLDSSCRYEAIWKNLSLISCWMDNAAGFHAHKLKKYFPTIKFQNKGLLATEGVMTIPWEEAGGNIPAYTSHFLEFLDTVGGSVKLINELNKQQEYTLVITTGSGLYRYNTGDRVRVEDFYEGLPVLKFIGREKLSDIVGEKLDDAFVSRSVLGAIQEFPIAHDFIMLSPELSRDGGQYVLYIQASIEIQRQSVLDFRQSLESHLRQNFYYRHALDIHQLKPLRVFLIKKDAKTVYMNRCIKEGQKLGDIKPSYLDNRDAWSRYFQGEMLPTP
jgi:hypothetical protein